MSLFLHLVHLICRHWPVTRGRDALMRHTFNGAFGRYLADLGPWMRVREGWRMKVNMGQDYTSLSLKTFGELEPVTKDFLIMNLTENGVFLDVGANVGYFSLLLALHQHDSLVISLEPNPAISSLLAESIRENQIQDRVFLHSLAASDTEGTLDFIVDDANSGHSRLSGDGREGSFKVKMIRLDDWLPSQIGGRHLAVVKIDVEGAEMRVLRGMKQLLQQHRPALVVEAYDEHLREFGDSLAEMRSFLKDCGYVEARESDGNLYMVSSKS